MQKPTWIVLCVVCFVAGIAAASVYHNSPANRDEEHWIKLSEPSNSEESLVSYSSDALFKSDIKLPNVRSLTGKAKFVKGTVSNTPDIKLGYIIDVDVAALDKKTIPEKYLESTSNQGDNSQAKKPIDAVYYEVVFYFILKDKDGFPLMKAVSNKETVHSGTNNHFQYFANNLIPATIASDTAKIDVRMEAVKCLTCESDLTEQKRVEGRHRKHSLF